MMLLSWRNFVLLAVLSLSVTVSGVHTHTRTVPSRVHEEGQDQECTSVHLPNTDANYDLSALVKKKSESIDEGTATFKLCGSVTSRGQGKDKINVVGTLLSKDAEKEWQFGNLDRRTVSTLDGESDPRKGIQVQYGGYGLPCSGTLHDNRSVTFSISCDSGASDDFENLKVELQGDHHCELAISFDSSSACPHIDTFLDKLRKLSSGWVFLIILTTLATIYLVFGILYKGCGKGASGLEVIPNISFWRSFFSNVALGAKTLYDMFPCRKMINVDESVAVHPKHPYSSTKTVIPVEKI